MHAYLTANCQLPTSPDTLEIRPDTSIGIAEVRQIQTFLSRKPFQSHNTVVINEAEKLTLPAQHALLKTLEEPPGDSQIYLVTSYPDVLLPTILSRVQIISTPSPSYSSYLPNTSYERDPLAFLDSQSFTRESFSAFLDQFEYYLHQQIQKNSLALNTSHLALIFETRKFLKSNCNLRLILTFFASSL